MHLFKYKAKDKSSTMEASYLTVCFDILGKIAANFATHLVVLRTNPLRLPLEEPEQLVSPTCNPCENQENTNCICGR